MKTNDLVSVILPCYNESGNIIPLIEAIHQTLSFCEHQILVVDDNSPDGTYQLVKNKNYPFVKAILRTQDPSLAKSIRTGLEEADGNIFLIMDSDFNHQPQYIPQMIRNLEFYDAVYACRFVYGGGMESNFRHISSWLFNIYLRMITRKFVTDSLYGFVAIKKEVIEQLNYDAIFWGYGDYCIRMTYYLQSLKANILQIPALNGVRLAGQSKSRFLKMLFSYSVEAFKLAFMRKKYKRELAQQVEKNLQSAEIITP
jgi:dolichol-phosphate mannosyltransferase